MGFFLSKCNARKSVVILGHYIFIYLFVLIDFKDRLALSARNEYTLKEFEFHLQKLDCNCRHPI